jgi:hypothetical protein
MSPVSDLGDWAYYQPGELNVSRGRMLLTVSNTTGTPVQETQYVALARVIVSKLN